MTNLELSGRIVEELLGDFQESVQIRDPILFDYLLTSYPISGKYFFDVNENYIWIRTAYLKGVEHRRRQKEAQDSYNAIIFARKDAITKLHAAILAKLGLKTEDSFLIALKIVQQDAADAAMAFGVDLFRLPKLDKPHLIIDGTNSYYL